MNAHDNIQENRKSPPYIKCFTLWSKSQHLGYTKYNYYGKPAQISHKCRNHLQNLGAPKKTDMQFVFIKQNEHLQINESQYPSHSWKTQCAVRRIQGRGRRIMIQWTNKKIWKKTWQRREWDNRIEEWKNRATDIVLTWRKVMEGRMGERYDSRTNKWNEWKKDQWGRRE